MRKLKEEKMNNPQRNIPLPIDVQEQQEKEKERGKRKEKKPKKTLAEQLAELNRPAEPELAPEDKPTKWYMGDYAHNEGTYLLHLKQSQINSMTPIMSSSSSFCSIFF